MFSGGGEGDITVTWCCSPKLFTAIILPSFLSDVNLEFIKRIEIKIGQIGQNTPIFPNQNQQRKKLGCNLPSNCRGQKSSWIMKVIEV